MNPTRFQTPPRRWGPLLSRFWVRFWRPLRRRTMIRQQRLLEVEVRGLEHLREAVEAGHGVLITPNHSGHADALILYEAADRLGRPFYFMTAWQVLGLVNVFRRTILRQHGCFSVDREGTDLQAFKQAVGILQSKPHPLVIFPEGEVYHLNERVTPFREGPATMALSAAKRAERPIVCVPCGIWYHYVQDPTPELTRLMDDLERAMLWRPRPDLPLAKRIYRLGEALVSLKELEYLDRTRGGTLPERISHLADSILSRLEERYGAPTANTTPERVRSLRQKAIKQMEEAAQGSAERTQAIDDLDELFFVVQSFSYPGDYVAERPTIERMAETLDKFEEDVLRRPTAGIRGKRSAVVKFGEPVPVEFDRKNRHAAAELTRLLEQRVQGLLDELAESAVPAPEEPAAAASELSRLGSPAT